MPQLQFEKKGKVITAKLDYNNLASGIFKSIMGAYMTDPKGTIAGSADYLKAIKFTKEESLGYKAYKLLTHSLETATANVLKDFSRQIAFKKEIKNIDLKFTNKDGKETDILFDHEFIKNPADHILVINYINYLRKRWTEKEKDTDIVIDTKLIFGLEEKFRSKYGCQKWRNISKCCIYLCMKKC